MDLLQNKVVIITGAAQGIGKAIAERCMSEGAIAILIDRNEASLSETAESLKKQYQESEALPIVADITDVNRAKSLLQDIYRSQGKIDCLINNAGVIINERIGMIQHCSLEQIFTVNVFATIEWTQIASRLMQRKGGGTIVNIASVTAEQGASGQSAYAASKGAVISFTKSAAKELAPYNIRVNAVAPGIIETERFDELYRLNGDKIDERIGRIALGRLGTPADVAEAVIFLASDKSSYVSGQILGVNGCASL